MEEKSATPTKSSQVITPTTGKLISKVTVNAIPSEYIVTNDANAVAEHILVDETAYVKGIKITGTMPNNESLNKEIDGIVISSVEIPAGYTTGGVVSLNGDIESALSAIWGVIHEC